VEILYGLNRFHFRSLSDLQRFHSAIPPQHAEKITSILISLDYCCLVEDLVPYSTLSSLTGIRRVDIVVCLGYADSYGRYGLPSRPFDVLRSMLTDLTVTQLPSFDAQRMCLRTTQRLCERANEALDSGSGQNSSRVEFLCCHNPSVTPASGPALAL
jgi:hypothetical protein